MGEGSTLVSPVLGLLTPDAGEVRRDVGIGGFTFRPSQKISVSGDVESASGDRNYFRTSLNDYTKMRARARYQAFGSLSFAVNVSLLDNQNPAVGVKNDYRLAQSSLSTLWAPKGGKRFTLQGDYTRSTVRSSILYLTPQDLRPAQSIYRENAHLATALVEVALPGYRKLTPRLSAGGSLLISAGTRPTRYYQPLGKLVIPLCSSVAWVSEWRYYGFGEVPLRVRSLPDAFDDYRAEVHQINYGFALGARCRGRSGSWAPPRRPRARCDRRRNPA